MIKLLSLVLTFISYQLVDSACEKSCLTKSYSLPGNSSASCNGNCQVKVEFSVIEQEYLDEYLNFTLIGYNLGVSEVKTIGLMLRKGTDSTAYMCSKEKSGLTSAYVNQGSITLTKGSSIYTNGNLYCSWAISKSDAIWPKSSGVKVDLSNDPAYQIWLLSGVLTFKVSNDLLELPIHPMQFIKCCGYIVRGNSNYSLIADQQINSTDFLLQILGESPSVVSVALTDPKNVTINTNCDYKHNQISSFVSNGTVSTRIQLPKAEIANRRCSWSLPGLIDSNEFHNLDTKKVPYNLQISSDKVSVYSESNVRLMNSTSSRASTVYHLIAILFPILINFL